MNIKILVAAHKKYQMPEDEIYFPIQVGAQGKEAIGFQSDAEGDNISAHNPQFCELTGIYWAWKNLDADYYGTVHYRRHFAVKKPLFPKNKFAGTLTKTQAIKFFESYDLILPQKRKYYIESIQSHFLHLPYTFEKDLLILKQVIKEMSPEYEQAFETVMNRTSAHMFNMFIMKKELFESYCAWMFPILLEANRRIDTTSYSNMEARVIGYFGEFMIDTWLVKNPVKYKELPVIYMEKLNWWKKITSFFGRKMGLKDKFYSGR